MTTYEVPTDFSALHGRTILITGCATGIGREAAKLAYANGANLALADVSEKESQTLLSELNDDRYIISVDVSDWESFRDIFDAAIAKFGVIHAVLSNAGIHHENLLGEQFDANGSLKAPDTSTININLISQLYATKLAFHYFKKGPPTSGPRQIVYTGAASAYIDTPLYQYSASKGGILGLFRAFRPTAPKANVSINMVAPWMTETNMTPPIISATWGDLPRNSAAGVAKALLLPVIRPEIHGKSLWVGGDEIVEFEDKIQETQPLWMGAKLSADVEEGQRRMMGLATNPLDAMAGNH
ncbi:hypothetical protein BKA63DRAFT_421530 [Paraphoma chrysanthemicola]|nr:hypothetical protein BKA63DRAFT_421530 [Paraphoma chrysanthemicola]